MTDTAASIPYEGTDCTADEAVETVEAVRATAATEKAAYRSVTENPRPYPAGEPGVFDLGARHYVVLFGQAGYRWWHDCPAVEHVSWGWFGQVSPDQVSGHRVVHHVPSLTVEGSLLCTDCGDHGFIRNTKWVPA